MNMSLHLIRISIIINKLAHEEMRYGVKYKKKKYVEMVIEWSTWGQQSRVMESVGRR